MLVHVVLKNAAAIAFHSVI